ncbi:MAG TPA: lipopolysaccharide heptosyltransferase II [Verrucomicrobiae bacterium]|nr:lipopolysaccharide heptosyltransferase II [Verrucomicrobiae bacterium]
MKILVRATNWVGDAVMSIPALRAIRARWPNAEVTILARPWVADLYRGQGYADRILVYDNKSEHRGFWGKERLARALRREKFEAAVLFPNAFDAAWIAWRAAIPERIGYARDGRSWLLTRAIPVPAKGEAPAHEVYDHLELLRRAGWLERLPHVDEISIRVPDEDRQKALERLFAAGVRKNSVRIAFASGAAYGSAKCWEPERYAALADRLIAAFDADVILFGAPQENDMAARIVGAMRHRACNLVGTTKIGELPALLSACRLFIGNDSGAMHVAGAVGVPVIGIFGPSDPEGTRPMAPQFTLIREPVECSPCFLRKCPIDHRCMTRISVERVFEAAQSLLMSGPMSGLTAGDRAKTSSVWSQRLA